MSLITKNFKPILRMYFLHKNNFSIIAVGFILLFQTSCIDPISIDPGVSKTQLVVEGIVSYKTYDTLHLIPDTVKLSYTTPYLDNTTFMFENNALVTIKDAETGVLDTLLLETGNRGRYLTQKLKPRVGSVLTLNITLSNGKQYTAQSEIHKPALLFGLETVDTTRTIGPGGPLPPGGYVKLKALDYAEPGNCYWFKNHVKRRSDPNNIYYTRDPGSANEFRFYRQPRNLYTVLDAFIADNNRIPRASPVESPFSLPVEFLVLNAVEEDRTYPAYFPGDSIKLEILSVDRPFLDFLARLRIEIENGTGGGFSGLFATPATNVPTNIFPVGHSERAVGFFAGASIVQAKTMMTLNAKFAKN